MVGSWPITSDAEPLVLAAAAFAFSEANVAESYGFQNLPPITSAISTLYDSKRSSTVAIAGIVAGEKLAKGCGAAIKWLPESSAKRPAPRVTIFRFRRPEEDSSGNRNDSKDLLGNRVRWTF